MGENGNTRKKEGGVKWIGKCWGREFHHGVIQKADFFELIEWDACLNWGENEWEKGC